jgi:hypothetical protein
MGPYSTVSIYPHVYRKLSYDPTADFQPVSTTAIIHHGFAVGPVVPESVKDVKGFIAWAKANPDKANYGSPAAGSTPHFLGALLGLSQNFEFKHIPYRGSVPGITDVVGGQVASMFTPGGDFLANHRAGLQQRLAVDLGVARVHQRGLQRIEDGLQAREVGAGQPAVAAGHRARGAAHVQGREHEHGMVERVVRQHHHGPGAELHVEQGLADGADAAAQVVPRQRVPAAGAIGLGQRQGLGRGGRPVIEPLADAACIRRQRLGVAQQEGATAEIDPFRAARGEQLGVRKEVGGHAVSGVMRIPYRGVWNAAAS